MSQVNKPLMGIWQWRSNTGELRIDQGMRQIYGFENNVITDSDFQSLIHPEDRSRTHIYFRDAVRNGTRIDITYRVLRMDFPQMSVRVRGETFINDSSGLKIITGVVVVESELYVDKTDELVALIIRASRICSELELPITSYLLDLCRSSFKNNVENEPALRQ
jgi:PAS domain-containing protein